MSDNMRWRYGDTNPVVAAVNAAEVIEIGDVLWQDTNNAKPAAEKAWVNSLSETQDALSAKFLGVAMQRHRAVDAAAQMRVATTGVFEFTCAASAFTAGSTGELGCLVGPAKASGNTLENQKVVPVTDAARAIGRLAKPALTTDTTVLVEITSVVLYGGPQVHTASTG